MELHCCKVYLMTVISEKNWQNQLIDWVNGFDTSYLFHFAISLFLNVSVHAFLFKYNNNDGCTPML